MEMCLRLNETSSVIQADILEDGITRTKTMDVDAFLDCLSGSVKRGSVSTGLLPQNCVCANLFDDGSRSVAILHPELYADISYFKTIYERFPIPRMLFGFRVCKDGGVTGCYISVVGMKERLKPESKLYVYPFSNVYSDFRACTGVNTLPKAESLHTLSSLPYYILSMPNNMDHYDVAKNKQGWEMRQLLNEVKDKSPEFYYSDVLIESGKTLNDFMEVLAR